MTLYISLANLIAGAPALLDRLTTHVRRDRGRSPQPLKRARPGQSPPQALDHDRGQGHGQGLWGYRLRIETIRPNDLSPHLRRDIGLDR